MPDEIEESVQEVQPSKTDILVETWFSDHFPNSPVAQNTAAWNVAHAAKEDLKKRLAALA